jgi:hypothetical protein
MFSKKYLFYSFIAILSLNFIACSGDDEPVDPVLLNNDGSNNGGGNNGGGGNTGGGNNGGGITQSNVSGVYLMTAFNSSVPVDLNGDGTASTNQINETNCFNNSLLTLNQNNTFVSVSKGIDINYDFDVETGEEITTIECFTEESATGTWAFNNSTVVFSYVEDGETFSDTFTIVGNTLVYTVANGQVVGTTDQGEPIYLTSSIQIIYTKQ